MGREIYPSFLLSELFIQPIVGMLNQGHCFGTLKSGWHNMKDLIPEPFENKNSEGISLKHFDVVVNVFRIAISVGTIKGI